MAINLTPRLAKGKITPPIEIADRASPVSGTGTRACTDSAKTYAMEAMEAVRMTAKLPQPKKNATALP